MVREKIMKKHLAVWIWGPFPFLPVANLRVSSLGVVPKRIPGEYCFIHDVSHLQHESVNGAIPAGLCTVRNSEFYQAMKTVHHSRVGAYWPNVILNMHFAFSNYTWLNCSALHLRDNFMWTGPSQWAAWSFVWPLKSSTPFWSGLYHQA